MLELSIASLNDDVVLIDMSLLIMENTSDDLKFKINQLQPTSTIHLQLFIVLINSNSVITVRPSPRCSARSPQDTDKKIAS